MKYVRIELVSAFPLDREGPSGCEPVPGYEVVHADGRVTWSESSAFEAIHVGLDFSTTACPSRDIHDLADRTMDEGCANL